LSLAHGSDEPSDAYLSPFRGFWTDRADAGERAGSLLQRGQIDEAEHAALKQFITDGYAIVRGAIGDELIDALAPDLDRVFRGETPRRMSYWDKDGHHLDDAREEKMMQGEAKLLDIHWVSRAAQDIIFAPVVKRFLTLVFRDRPLAFQSLYFKRGSEQGIHQDTAFVPVAEAPLDFVASWIALEDVEPGVGELLYVPRSHRLPDLAFQGGGKKCTPEDPLIGKYTTLVRENYETAGLAPQAFLPRKGDVLFWAADLAHGGARITRREATRRSLVTHYCPLVRRPEYARRGKDYPIRQTPSGGYVISQT
jgi:ectoine hydroxylase-related dioxygenase (phytanoyl-CoA dioxygenase family)